ncbi:nucleoside recognition domain-containing protein [Lacihabitans lacunae]|jgi:spore maturation protein SpmA|uniref:Nucleoside recognition domain-containing protein n=1 Tax=Lacihabitans lacunae TaxID=1028214 RepID=A0ABV7YUH7_9BACT
MALNYIWVGFFLVAFIVALFKLIFFGDTEIFKLIIDGMFESAESAVMNLALPLAGVMTFFLGILKIGEEAGVIRKLAKVISPFFSRLFPEVPKDHPANGQMIMNFSANMLGLDNAATPFGLKAMQSLQELNPSKDTASNSQIMFMVLHSAGPVLIPISIMAQRAIYNAADPSDIFIPALISVYMATFTGLLFVGIKQKINFFEKTLFLWLLGISGFIGFVLWYFAGLPKEEIETTSKVVSNLILMLFIVGFIGGAVYKKVDVFSAFIDGAKSGFETSVKVIPYLVGMLVAISAFRNSGALDYVVDGFKFAFSFTGLNTDFTDALPTALMHPLSGSGSRAMMIDSMKTFGADSFIGRLSCVFQASSDTILYILALYFGSVSIKHTRYTLVAGLLADLVGVITAIFVSYIFFH